MFSFLKKEEPKFVSIAEGELLPLDQVKDAVFAQKMMGDGIAFHPSGDTIYAPCSGSVMMVANTKHAIGLKNNDGIEVLIHIGLDTVNLQGKGFTCLVANGDKIKKGQPLMKLDRKYFAEQKLDLTTPMVITNTNGTTLDITAKTGATQPGDDVITYQKP